MTDSIQQIAESNLDTCKNYRNEVRNNEILCDSVAVHGVKTVTTTATSLFAGTSKKSRRKRMRVTNDGSVIIYYGIGDSAITTATGQPIQPGEYEDFYFNPLVSIDIYFIAVSSNANVRIMEI